MADASEADIGQLSGKELLRRLRWLVFFAWSIPPIFGLSFILLIGVLQRSQLIGILTTPVEPAYIALWLAFSLWFLPKKIHPLACWLDGTPACSPADAQVSVRRFGWMFWTTFLIYLAVAPASVILAAEIYTDFKSTPVHWFRIELVALIVSIIVGLPIFFLMFNLFGQALGGLRLMRPILSIRTRVFLIGALVPLLIDTILVQYYWTRTGHFTIETVYIWLLLELIAIGGSLIFARSFGLALGPLQKLDDIARTTPNVDFSMLKARSTDEIGVLTSDYRALLEKQQLQKDVLELNNRLLHGAAGKASTASLFSQVVELCQQAVNVSQAFLLVLEPAKNELSCVIQSGSTYRPEGYFRFRLDETSLAVWVYNQRQTVAVEDVEQDPRVNRIMSGQLNVRSALATPLQFDDSVVGVLVAATHDSPRIYTEYDIALIEGLAHEAGHTLHTQQLSDARARAEAERREQQELSVLLLNSTAEGIYGVDRQGVCTFVNASCLRILGYKHPEELVGKVLHNLIHHTYPDGRPYPLEECQVRSTIREGKPAHSADEIHWRADGSSISVEYWSHPIYRNGQLDGAVVTFIDITERKKAEEQLRIAAVTFETQDATMITDSNSRILRVNDAFQEITGYTQEEVIGENPRILKSGRHDAAFYQDMWSALHANGRWSGEIWDKRKGGEIYPKAITITAVYDEQQRVMNYVAVFRDISQNKKAAQEIHQLAFYDSLTQLPNRRMLMDRLNQAMAVSARSGWYGALCFLDLDHFKTINDTQGHIVGDMLLKEVACRLQACVREGDSVARLGGDEFVVVLGGLNGKIEEAASQAERIIEKVQHALRQPYLLDDYACHTTTSIGICLFSGHRESIEDLLKHADTAMYQAKEAGRNAIRFFDPVMQTKLEIRATLEAALRQALEKRQFQPYYQIQVDNQGSPIGAELLLRWEHPELGLISPIQFITLAEETGLITSIGSWVLYAACAQLKKWQDSALTRDLILSVNVSARQLRQNDFVAQVKRMLSEHGVQPSQLKLELTESTVLEDVEDTIGKMHELKALGILFSMDDFGTGYSSLQYLKRLPLDQIKIDQSFVRDITTDPNDAAIVQTIIAMTETLGLEVIAEGVETEGQREFLDLRGCHAFQGYLFGKPLPLEQFENLVKRCCETVTWP